MTNTELDRAVAEAQKHFKKVGLIDGEVSVCDAETGNWLGYYSPTTNWQQCGELIEKYHISLAYLMDGRWHAIIGCNKKQAYGDTPQEAVCKAVVAMEGE